MAVKGAQFALPIAAPAQFSRAQFFVSPSNARALTLIETWPNWPDKVLVMIGPKGSGKTHLAHIFGERANATPIAISDICHITRATLLLTPVLIIDNADIGLHSALEAPLFHLLNLIREIGQGLLLTANSSPDNWGIETPDLLSRLRLAPSVRLQEPDDALFRATLRKIIQERQLVVDAATFDYIAVRLDRSLDAAHFMLEKMDQASLQHQRAITRHLAAEIINAELGQRNHQYDPLDEQVDTVTPNGESSGNFDIDIFTKKRV